jgi:transcriptional regulator with XRE-family HTH domain
MVAGAGETADFAALLRELKDRSGLSYGVLAKRLHMSTSTLHRYCNGDAVPTEYAPVERLARLCKATPEELVEAHRRWILADGARLRERKVAMAAATAGTAGTADTAGTVQRVTSPGTGLAAEPGTEPATDPRPVTGPGVLPGHGQHLGSGAPKPLVRKRRAAVLAATAVAVALVSAALVPRLVPGGDDGRKQSVDAASTAGRSAASPDAPPRSASSSSSSSASATASASTSVSANPSASRTASGQALPSASGKPGGSADPAGAVPLTVTTRPYAWEDPCSQSYLIDRPPAKVPPPPEEQDAPGWVSALGGVSADGQFLELTAQGTGQDTVVLQALHVRVVNSGAPLAWNAYTMGVGCGGGVPTKSFDVDLDAGRPDATPKSGQRDFPYKVSESDPEVLYVTGHTESHDVNWYLELEWSSGNRHGVLRIDDQGKPFRTSGMTGRPRYDYPLGGNEWGPHQYG